MKVAIHPPCGGQVAALLSKVMLSFAILALGACSGADPGEEAGSAQEALFDPVKLAAATGAFYGDTANLAADVNGDGRSDLIAQNHGTVYVRVSFGGECLTGTCFGLPALWATGEFFADAANLVGDVDGDGLADLIAQNHGSVYVRQSTGTGFGPVKLWATGAFYGTLTHVAATVNANLAADMNGDGKTDLIAVNDESVYVRLSNGSGFDPAQLWATGAFYGSIQNYAADVDGDGRADLIAQNTGSVYVRRSTGTGFGPVTLWASGAFYGTLTAVPATVNANFAADVNGDGKTDLVAVNDGSVYVRLSNGAVLGPVLLWATGTFYGSVQNFATDVDGDLKADLIAQNDTSIYLRLATADIFGPVTLWANGGFYGTLTQVGSWVSRNLAADVNGDGKADLIAINDDSVYVRLSTGGGFGLPLLWGNGGFYGAVQNFAADVNNDGKADLIAQNTDSIYVRLSTGGGFGAPLLWGNGAFGIAPTGVNLAADINGDGRTDLIAQDDDDGSISYRLSTGTQFGPTQSTYTNGLWLYAVGDVNGDHQADLIFQFSNLTDVRLSNGWGFGSLSWWANGEMQGTQANFMADVNGDGKADQIAQNPDGAFVRLAKGSTKKPFANPDARRWCTGAFYGSVGNFSADVNGDGRADLIAQNADSVYVRLSMSN